MKLPQATFLLLASSLAAAAAGGVSIPESDFYPVLEYWKANEFHPNVLCKKEYRPPSVSEKAKSYPYRSSLGLKQLGESLDTLYSNSLNRLTARDLDYLAAQRRTLFSLDSQKQCVVQKTSNGGDFRTQWCECLRAATAEQQCSLMGNWSQNVQCMDDYQYENNAAVLSSLDPANDFGFVLPDSCYATTTAGGDPLKLELESFGNPASIAPDAARPESPVYYLLLKAIDRLNRYGEYKYLSAIDQLTRAKSSTATTPPPPSSANRNKNIGLHELFRTTDIFAEILPTWEVRRVFYMNQPRFLGGPTLRSPYAILAKRRKSADILLVLRSSQTTYDSRLALYNQQSFKYLYNFTGEAHDGSTTIYQTLSGVLDFALDSVLAEIDETFKPRNLMRSRVTVVAQDLPATGAATLLANHIRDFIEEKTAGTLFEGTFDHQLVLFGSGLVVDNALAAKLAKDHEIRVISFEEDGTDLFPCKATYSCDERVLPPRTGIETGALFNYAPLPGKVTVSAGLHIL